MTKHEADVIGGLNMTDQISNEAYKQIMIAAQDENEVDDVLDKIRAEIDKESHMHDDGEIYIKNFDVKRIINRYREGESK
jgi:hypothetical protein